MPKADRRVFRATFWGFQCLCMGRQHILKFTEHVDVRKTAVRLQKWEAFWVRTDSPLYIEAGTPEACMHKVDCRFVRKISDWHLVAGAK